MRLSNLTVLGLFLSIKVFSQHVEPYFPSRIEFMILTPKFISSHNIKTIKVSDHFVERFHSDFELLYNKRGVVQSYIYLLDENQNKSKRFKFDPIDTIFYNRTNNQEITTKDMTASIKYLPNGKIEKIFYTYRNAIIGCPIKSISFNYNSTGRILNETLSTCLDSVISTYIYQDNLIMGINCTIFRTNRDTSGQKNTINDRYEVNYNPAGLLESINKVTDPDIYINYNYTFKK